jgi:hypothetical protein
MAANRNLKTLRLLSRVKAIIQNSQWLDLGEQLDVDWDKIEMAQWVAGCHHELEHWKTVGENPKIIAGIAFDHLREDPNYYRKLQRIEKDNTQKALHIAQELLPPLSSQEIEQLAKVTTQDVKEIHAKLEPAIRDLLDAD